MMLFLICLKNYFIILITNFANQLSLYSVILSNILSAFRTKSYNLVVWSTKCFSSAVLSDVIEETSFKTFKAGLISLLLLSLEIFTVYSSKSFSAVKNSRRSPALYSL